MRSVGRSGGGGVVGGGTLTDGGGYWGDCVRGAPKTKRGRSTTDMKRHELFGEKNSHMHEICNIVRLVASS